MATSNFSWVVFKYLLCALHSQCKVTRYHFTSKDNCRTVVFDFLIMLFFCILGVISIAIYCHAISCIWDWDLLDPTGHYLAWQNLVMGLRSEE